MFAMIFVVLMFLTVQKYPYIKKERKTSLFVEVPIRRRVILPAASSCLLKLHMQYGFLFPFR